MSTIVLDGDSLTIEDTVRIAREGVKVAIADAARAEIKRVRGLHRGKLADRERAADLRFQHRRRQAQGLCDQPGGQRSLPAQHRAVALLGHRRASLGGNRARHDGGSHQHLLPRRFRAAHRGGRPAGRDAEPGRASCGADPGVGRRFGRPRAACPYGLGADRLRGGRSLFRGHSHAGAAGACEGRHFSRSISTCAPRIALR